MREQGQTPVYLHEADALSVTDVQNDFLPGGALGVPYSDIIIPPLNRLVDLFEKNGLLIFFSRDWHPADHCSFKDQGGPWPPHCVQNTPGAQFPSALLVPEGSVIISKGMQKEKEQYSTFGAQDSEGNTQAGIMKQRGIGRLFVAGLATNYCVLSSVKDILAVGYEVYVLIDAIRAVHVNPVDAENALVEIVRGGAKFITTDMLREKK
jgi:nicotinamidase/pyrazinamidase